jgi:hypothetical protein
MAEEPTKQKPGPSSVAARDPSGGSSVYHWYLVSLNIGKTNTALVVQAPSYADALCRAEAIARRRNWFGRNQILATTAKILGPAPEPPRDTFWEELAR